MLQRFANYDNFSEGATMWSCFGSYSIFVVFLVKLPTVVCIYGKCIHFVFSQLMTETVFVQYYYHLQFAFKNAKDTFQALQLVAMNKSYLACVACCTHGDCKFNSRFILRNLSHLKKEFSSTRLTPGIYNSLHTHLVKCYASIMLAYWNNGA